MAGYSVTYSVVDNATKNIDAINRRIQQMRAPMERMSRSVSRFVDVSGLQKVAQGFDWIGKAAGTVLRTLTTIVPVMGAITGAASIAGMMKLVSSYAAWSHELVQAADNIGTTTQQLQQFQDATRLAGGEASDMTESLKGLHNTLGNINIGSGNAAQALQWFNRLGINVRDANGHIRSTTELMPELIQKIAAMKDPLDRARAANELLGASGDKLVETFRQSSQTFAQWFSDVSRYKDLTDEQKKSLQLFTEAQGRLGVAFDRMGQQISVVIARDFTPLMNKISEFVEKHTPEIIAAVDRISQRFIDWLQGIDWSKVEDGINKLLEGLKWVVNNLDTIKDVAEAIAVAFSIKWGVGIVADIAAVTTALAPLSAALLPIVAALGVITAYEKNKAGQQEIENQAKGMGFQQQSGGMFGMPTFRNPTTGETLTYDQMLERQGRPHGGGGWIERGLQGIWDRAIKGPEAIQPQGTVTPGAAHPTGTAANPAQLVSAVSSTLDIPKEDAAAIVSNMKAESGLVSGINEQNPTVPGSRGGYGLVQWTGPRRVALEEFAKRNNLDVSQQSTQLSFMKEELKKYPGLLARMQAAKTPEEKATIFFRGYESGGAAGLEPVLPKHIAHAAEYAALPSPPLPPVAAAAPVTVPPPTPVNGAVDVSITHKNAPPNSAVTATGSGSVNVAPVRVEHQDMASI